MTGDLRLLDFGFSIGRARSNLHDTSSIVSSEDGQTVQHQHYCYTSTIPHNNRTEQNRTEPIVIVSYIIMPSSSSSSSSSLYPIQASLLSNCQSLADHTAVHECLQELLIDVELAVTLEARTIRIRTRHCRAATHGRCTNGRVGRSPDLPSTHCIATRTMGRWCTR